MLDDLIFGVMDKTEHRYFGKYKASVADNADPENRGRLRLRIPSILGDTVISGWALPCAPYGGSPGQGFFFIPEKDAGVWVEFEAGLLDYPVWVGTYWSKPGGQTEAPPPGSQQSPPSSKLIKTLKHTLELADGQGGESITITDDANNNTVVLDQKGITVQDKSGRNIIALSSKGVTITSNNITLGADSASQPLVLGTTFKGLLDSFFQQVAFHTHVGNLGAPTSLPLGLVSPDLSSGFSKNHMVDK
jgi:uncharacterized protein involved in type VI secretion and phage assembly